MDSVPLISALQKGHPPAPSESWKNIDVQFVQDEIFSKEIGID